MTSTTFDISINDDNILEGDKNFMLNIGSSSLPPGVTHGDPSSATVTIVDDDSK